jgi:hypothetical protein
VRSLRLIGDIHGEYTQYAKLLDHPNTVQIGDFGMGFHPATAASVDTYLDAVEKAMDDRNAELARVHSEGVFEPPPSVPTSHRFIRGNHDDPGECRKSKHWISDGHYEGGIMFIGGAASIDKAYRTEGVSWWPDEEISDVGLNILVEEYDKKRPRVMVTHECPESIARHVMIPLVKGAANFLSRTREAFERMLAIHAPELWVFGHWHTDITFRDEHLGTVFQCLGILSHVDIEV